MGYPSKSMIITRSVRNQYSVERYEDRRDLPERKFPYWVNVARGRSIGFAKRQSTRSWIARIRLLDGTYRHHWICEAETPGGQEIQTFWDALRRAQDFFLVYELDAISPIPPVLVANVLPPAKTDGPYTFGHAAHDYINWLGTFSPNARERAYAIRTHIWPTFAHVPLEELTASQIETWLKEIAIQPARKRTAAGLVQAYKPPPRDFEEARRRRNTANQQFSTLRAILNKAYANGHVSTNRAWAMLRAFRNVSKSRTRVLSHEQCRALLAAADPPIRDLIAAAMHTGCRTGSLCGMLVHHYEPSTGRVFVENAKNHRVYHVILTEAGNAFFADKCADRPPRAPMFLRANGTGWTPGQALKELYKVSKKADIDPAVTFYDLRHTYASHALMSGVSAQVLRHQMGHADTRMIEHHYGHLTNSYIVDQVRDLMPELGSQDEPGPE